MIGCDSTWRSFQRSSFDRDPRSFDRFPLRRTARDRPADFRERLRVGMPDAGGRKAFFRRNVEVETRDARSGFSLLVKKVDAEVRLVRGFVAREPRVSINAEHRAAHRTRIRNQTRRDSMQPRCEITDEAQGAVADLRFVSLLVRREPI